MHIICETFISIFRIISMKTALKREGGNLFAERGRRSTSNYVDARVQTYIDGPFPNKVVASIQNHTDSPAET
jgi:hypothetical protein